MKAKSLKVLLVSIICVALFATAGWAKKTAYGYIISYSARDQIVYYTPIFTQTVSGVSYSDEEFVAPTSVTLKLESEFQKHLVQTYSINNPNFTTSARAAFKTEAIARTRFNEESGTFRFRGFQLIEVPAFKP